MELGDGQGAALVRVEELELRTRGGRRGCPAIRRPVGRHAATRLRPATARRRSDSGSGTSESTADGVLSESLV